MPTVRTELQIGGVWTDVTADVYTRDPITITRGTADEATSADPSGCSLTFNNRLGQYSPRNPMSPYYGAIGRNTPIRVSVQGSESYLQLEGTTASYASTPDTAALDITGDIDLRIEATTDWYGEAIRPLIGKWISATNQRSYMLRLENGFLALRWSTDGVGSLFAQQPLPLLPRRAALRATLDVNNGSGGFTARIYWAKSMDGPWTQIGDALTVAGVTSIYAGTSPLEIAPTAVASSTSLPGRVHRAEVRSGIGGTAVASPDLRGLAEGTTGWSDSAGRAWTLGPGGTISNRAYRFHGEISSWPPRWDVSGRDVWVPVEASGPTRRMGQGKKALDSTLRRRIPSDPNLIAYWPMEDGTEATAAYSPLPGIAPLSISGIELAADDSLGGASTVAKIGSPATLQGTVPRAATQGWQVEWVYNLPALPALQTEIMRVSVAGSVMRAAVVYASTSGIRIEAQDADGTVLAFFLYNAAAAVADFWGKWNRLAIYTSDNGAGTTRLYAGWRDIAADSRYNATTTFTGTQGAVTGVSGAWGTATADMLMGHLAVFNIPAATGASSPPGSIIFSGADDGFTGETALARLKRLAAEEAAQVALSVRGEDVVDPAERLGPQRPGVFLDLVEEAAETDGGILYERCDQLGALQYRDRQSLYTQPVALALDYTAPGEVPPPLEPTEDDQRLRNDVTVTRIGGSSGRAVLESGPLSIQPPPAGVGPYDESLSLSLYSDSQPEPIAQWRQHLGTWDEARYPTITVWLHTAPHLIDDVLGMDIGDRLTITHLPPWLPPGLIDQHMRGYTEVLDQDAWSLAMNCVPAGPWTVGTVGDPLLGRADTDGTELAAAVTASQTGWPLTVTAGPAWITTAAWPAEFPFDVQAGGEVATVTAITGVAEDGFARTVVSGWGTADSGQAWSLVGGSTSDFAVNGSIGRHNMTTVNVFRHSLAVVPVADVDLRMDVTVGALPVGDSAYVFPVVRYTDTTHLYFARVQISPAGVMTLTLRKRNGAETQLGSAVVLGTTYTAMAWYTIRLAAVGPNLMVKCWPMASAEPTAWQIAASDSDLTAPGSIGFRTLLGASVSNAPITAAVNNVVCSPQQMTVTRAVNSISKSHAAGTDLRLAQPTIVAL